MEGLSYQELIDLYHASSPEVRLWMHDNVHFLFEK